jgi:hypothetical protein
MSLTVACGDADSGGSTEAVDASVTDTGAAASEDDDDVSAPIDVASTQDAVELQDAEADVSEDDIADGDPEPPACDCQVWEYCAAAGACVDDLCDQGTTTCAPPSDEVPQGLQVCSEDGSGVEIVACADAEVCHLGVCQAPVCEPNAPIGCTDGQLEVCNSVGTATVMVPCPGGSACLDGACVSVEPNVIVLLDTSGSMNAIDDLGTLPQECEGDDCPSWSWPDCDDPDSPQTRFAKAKVALLGVLASEEAAKTRMALQRFPQKFDLFKLLGESDPTCGGVPLVGFDLFSKDNTQVHNDHAIAEIAPDGSDLTEIFPVRFGMDAEAARIEMARWLDLVHSYEADGEACANLSQCSAPIAEKACIAAECATSVEPELRAMGKTPLGRALFYAGETYRHTVVVQGRACAEDADCHSPHYSCVDGACHDPLRSCRPNLIILVSDGAETQDTNPELFFHPRNQAKRLRYGLGCATAADCLSGAACAEGRCQLPEDVVLPKAHQVVNADTCFTGVVVDDTACEGAVGEGESCCWTEGACHGTSIPCGNNLACSDYPYPCGGTASTCSGKCEPIDTGYIDDVGQDVLRDPAGDPFAVTVHVIDVVNAPTGTRLVAALAGGEHAVVDLDDLGGILDVFTPLLDIKANTDACQ